MSPSLASLEQVLETQRCRSKVIRHQVQSTSTSIADSAASSRPLFTLAEIAAGCWSGIIADSVLHPVDTIRTRLQVQTEGNTPAPPISAETSRSSSIGHLQDTTSRTTEATRSRTVPAAYRGVVDAALRMQKTEGALSLYQGIGATLLLSGPANALYFCSYEIGKRMIHNIEGNFGWRSPEWASAILAGAVADTAANTIWVPLDVVRQRMQVETRSRIFPTVLLFARDEGKVLRDILRNEGIRGLYVGFGSSVLTYAPFSAIYFAFYELFKDRACALAASVMSHKEMRKDSRLHKVSLWDHVSKSDESTLAIYRFFFGHQLPTPESYPFGLSLITAFASGAIGAFLTCPFDVVKTRIQVSGREGEGGTHAFKYSSSLRGLIKISKEEGIRGLFRGVWARALFFAPSCALTMALYEAIKQRWGLDDD